MECPKLIDWKKENTPKDTMSYKDVFYNEINFIKDKLSNIYWDIVDEYRKNQAISDRFETYELIDYFTTVISHHHSKSIKLPVVRIDLKEILGVVFIMRFNFHDWKVSVVSDTPIHVDFGSLFDITEKINPTYCEGFVPELVFDSYDYSPKRFTVELRDKFDVYTFVYIIINYLNKN